jgi:hypothetical protein
MALLAETKDCTGLSDSELSDMADICADGSAGYDVGILSKQVEQWVLVTQVRDGTKLTAFSFCTLERIGGTPSVLIGMASVKRGPRRDAVLRTLIGEQLRRAVLAFPDEDVLVGTRLLEPSGFAAFEGLEDIVPRPGHKATGEERAWGRRLAKRFGAEGRVDDRTFLITGTGDTPPALDHECIDAATLDPAVIAFFADLDDARGDALIGFGWAMAEYLSARARK